MEGWKECTLEELLEVASSKRIFYEDYREFGVPFYRSKEIIEKSCGQQVSTDIYISEKKFNDIKDKFGAPTCGDILLTSVGTIGIPYIVGNEEFYFKDGNLTWFKNFSKTIYSNYLKYWLISQLGKSALDEIVIGSTQQALTIAGLKKIKILLPPLVEQQAITAVLSSLDDKIDLLHRQNKTLEALAQTLFRQWFVEEADSDVEASLSDFAENIRENVTADYLNTFSNYIGLEHIEKKQMALYQCGNPENIASNKSKFLENDILFGKLRPYFHKVTYAPFDGICSTDILVIRPRQKEFFAFCLCLAFSDDFVQHSDIGSEGTRMPRTSWNILSNYKIAKPTLQRVRDFNVLVMPNIDKMTKNISQISTLTKLRDTLLPKLMSGEVRVA